MGIVGMGMGIEVAMLGNGKGNGSREKVLVDAVDLGKARVGDQLHGVM